jgi:hypothetical protein
MNRIVTRRNGIAAALAVLAIGLAAGGVGASTGSLTNEDRARSQPSPAAVRPSAKAPTNEQVLEREGRTRTRPAASRSSGETNDG